MKKCGVYLGYLWCHALNMFCSDMEEDKENCGCDGNCEECEYLEIIQ